MSSKQIIAASQPASRRILTEVVVNRVKENMALRERFEELGIAEIDIRQVLTDIFERKPIVGIPIDHVGADLREWAQTLKTEVKLWVVRKLVEFGNPQNVIYEIPDEYKPVLDTTPEADISTSGYRYYDVNVADLLGLACYQRVRNLSCLINPDTVNGSSTKQLFHLKGSWL